MIALALLYFRSQGAKGVVQDAAFSFALGGLHGVFWLATTSLEEFPMLCLTSTCSRRVRTGAVLFCLLPGLAFAGVPGWFMETDIRQADASGVAAWLSSNWRIGLGYERVDFDLDSAKLSVRYQF